VRYESTQTKALGRYLVKHLCRKTIGVRLCVWCKLPVSMGVVIGGLPEDRQPPEERDEHHEGYCSDDDKEGLDDIVADELLDEHISSII
jgi:hypothetical protein